MADTLRVDELQRRLRKDPSSLAFAPLADEHRRAGEHEEAVRICRAGLARHPGYHSARVILGRALIEMGRFEEAAAEIDRVLAAAPDNLAAERARQDLDLRESLANGRALTAAAASGPEASATRVAEHATHRDSPPGDPVVSQLETWLSAILADRLRRHSAGR